MKVLITGGSGLLGGYIQDELENHVNPLSYESVEYYAPSSHECNVMSKESVSRSFYSYNPDIVIHCAAIAKFKDVDKNPQKALMVNVTGTCNIIGQCEAGSLGRTDDGVGLGVTPNGFVQVAITVLASGTRAGSLDDSFVGNVQKNLFYLRITPT